MTPLLKTMDSPVGAEVMIDGRRYINFSGSSYLGLAAKPELISAGVDELRATGCRFQVPKHYQIASRAHQDVEQEAAAFFGTPSALFIAAGYYFGLLAIAALRAKYDVVFYDEWAHYSLQDGIAASKLKHYSYRHLDAEDLSAKIKKHLRPGERPLIATDGMYSTLGEIAPLDALWDIVAPYDGLLVVDESHSFGALGDQGRGAAEYHNVPANSVIIGGSTGKGFGVSGGIVLGTDADMVAFAATPVGRGAATGSPAAAAMCAESFRYIRRHPQVLRQLRENVSYMKAGLRKMGFAVPDGPAPVAAFVPTSVDSLPLLQEALMREGIFVLHSTYIGAGPAGVIRCGIFADHTIAHMDYFFSALRRLL